MNPGATRFCKICGVEYPYCHTNIPSQYRWQDVACCKEHAAQYFAEIAASRNQSIETLPDEYKELLDAKVEELIPVVSESEGMGTDDKLLVEDVTEDILLDTGLGIVETVGTRRRHKRR